MPHIVVIGGGFAGVWSALGASATRHERGGDPDGLRITLVSRDPYLTIRPRLYEADPQELRVPLPDLMEAIGVDLVVGNATQIDPASRTVVVNLATGRATISYDRLILAAGSRLRRPDIPGARDHTFGVDTYEEALALDRHLQSLVARPAAAGRFTAVIVGAGFTGLEVATTMVSRLRTLSARGAGERPAVVLVERADVVAPDLGSNARPAVETALRELAIPVRLGATIRAIDRGGVTLATGEYIAAATTVWTAGLWASDLTSHLPAERDDLGRVAVDAFLRVRGLDAVFAAGDVARAMADSDHVAPMSCQYAIPMGERAGRNAAGDLLGRPLRAFQPPPYVTCLDLGEWGGLFTQGWEREVRLSGHWGKVMKEMINTRLIYPPSIGGPGVLTATPNPVWRFAA